MDLATLKKGEVLEMGVVFSQLDTEPLVWTVDKPLGALGDVTLSAYYYNVPLGQYTIEPADNANGFKFVGRGASC